MILPNNRGDGVLPKQISSPSKAFSNENRLHLIEQLTKGSHRKPQQSKLLRGYLCLSTN